MTDPTRCALCGLPLSESWPGCKPGACAYQPPVLPELYFDPARAAVEAVAVAGAPHMVEVTAQQLTDDAGIGAFRAARELLRADANIHVKLNKRRKAMYVDAAKADGYDNLTAWILALCDTRVGASKKEPSK